MRNEHEEPTQWLAASVGILERNHVASVRPLLLLLDNNMRRLALTEVHSLASNALKRAGLLPASSDAVASVVADAERDGCKSHGLFRIPGYIKTISLGKADVAAEPVVEVTSPGVVQVDGARAGVQQFKELKAELEAMKAEKAKVAKPRAAEAKKPAKRRAPISKTRKTQK